MWNKLRNDFGIRIWNKIFTAEHFADFFIIFNDSVVHYSHFSVGTKMRMGVDIGHSSMGGPPCMADGQTGFFAGKIIGVSFRNLTHLFFSKKFTVLFGGDPPGIVTAVLQTLEPGETHVHGLFVTNVADYSTHLVATILSQYHATLLECPLHSTARY